jgi:hypothetical protein
MGVDKVSIFFRTVQVRGTGELATILLSNLFMKSKYSTSYKRGVDVVFKFFRCGVRNIKRVFVRPKPTVQLFLVQLIEEVEIHLSWFKIPRLPVSSYNLWFFSGGYKFRSLNSAVTYHLGLHNPQDGWVKSSPYTGA